MRDKAMNPADAPLYPIREVSRLTGVNAVTLRAWERRYGLIQPRRTPKGHRLYARDDIERIERILQWLGRGVSVSQVGDLLEQPENDDATTDGDWPGQRQQLIAAIQALDLARLESLYNQSLALYPIDVCLDELWQPVITQLDEHWRCHPGDVLQRHALEAFLRTRIGTRLYHANLVARGPQLLLAPLPDSGGPLWPLLFALAASHAGYRVQMMDSPLSHAELALAVERLGLDAVVLIGDRAERGAPTQRQLPRLAEQLSVPLCLVGVAAGRPASELETGSVTLLGDEPLPAATRLRSLLLC
ncbi:DNA-binding transcriptional regulator, MerR family [Modicisalibacter muralis]|uniref:DNA-binding transcriptional regulator, MerR family n=1 Tax=Modicisalibacter muralis TaxID=119000 RepID=A0A1G9QMS5_9GAMM|nr:MerR family transcriptional regulator [Halomonas muralis]SDM12314.1 DNA-binding transcriptional regulator, MerR family [Halomonas muralis]